MKITFDQYYIEPLETTDAKAFFTLIDNNKKRLETFFAGTISDTKTLLETEQYCQEIIERRRRKSYYPFLIKTNIDHQLIGLIDVKNIDWQIPKAELGYFIDADFEGKGIITKGVGLVVKYLVAEFNFLKLFCRANDKNIGSTYVALRNGFELEGTIRRDYRTSSGEIVDLNYYGKLF